VGNISVAYAVVGLFPSQKYSEIYFITTITETDDSGVYIQLTFYAALMFR
jgi:hypothetical protein